MMKWGFALNAVAGSALVASSLGVGQGDSQSLQVTLDRTLRDLENMAGIRARIEQGDRSAIADALKLSGPASSDVYADDQHLDALRVEVARLEMQRDGLAPLTKPVATAAKSATPTTTKTPSASAKAGTPADGLKAFEVAGFSADAVRQGEALFRAEKFQDCLSVLAKAPDDPRGQYWSARALERLGKTDEAIAAYTKLAARTDGGWAAERAKADLDFLQWKKSTEPAPSTAKKEPKKP